MDGKELLRRYLEQRRELGESELVLDKLHVDDVMRLLGVAGGAASETRGRSIRETVQSDTGDWRESLREAGVNVDAGTAATTPTSMPKPAPTKPNSQPSKKTDAPPKERPNARLSFSPEPDPNPAAKENFEFKKGLVVGSVEPEPLPGPIGSLPSLEAVAEKVQVCTRCPLYSTATNGVPGEGDPNAGLVCVGEAPGANEDATGRPFVGQAGQLLTKILGAIELTREQVFIVNVLKHRPPGNRNPQPHEVEACSPYLIRQLELIRPKVIVAFGTFAAKTLLQTKTPLGQLRGLVHRYHGIPLIVTYHPAALLRNPAWKRPTWEDVKLARRILDSTAA